jgi:site-specific recombinase XerD
MNINNALARLRPRSQHEYRQLPLFGSILDAFAEWILNRGFSLDTGRADINALRRLVPWFQRRRKRSVDDLCATDVVEVRRYYRHRQPLFAAAVGKLGQFLQAQRRLRPDRPKPLTRAQRELQRYGEHLRQECGLAEATIERHRGHLQLFLHFLGGDRAPVSWSRLTLARIQQFLRRTAPGYSREGMALVVGAVRSFLRFQFLRGRLAQPLHAYLDTIRRSPDERLPVLLPWVQVPRLLRALDRSTPLGLRDFTVLLLTATYGLRRSEVAALTLDDLDWPVRKLRLVQPKTRQTLWLPLTDEVGAALVDYLARRPRFPSRQVFLRVRPPIGPLDAAGVAESLARASRTTGIQLPTTRFHSLRYAVALRLLRQGVGLKSISDVLGHRDPNTTAGYLRLEIEDLRQVALPVPRLRMADSHTWPPEPGRYQPTPQPPRRITAPADQGWQSFLARPIRAYLALQRSLGRSYRREEWILRGLDFFLIHQAPRGRIFTAARFAAWAASLSRLSSTGVRSRLLCVHKFCLHLARERTGGFVPDRRLFPKPLGPKVPCLLSPAQMAQILAGTRTINPNRKHPLRPQSMRLALVLLYCCGLRRGELLRLCLADLDTDQMVLRVNQTKFHKSRLVPLSPSVAQELRAYLRLRQQKGLPMEPTAPLLWNGRTGRTGSALSQTAITANWLRICHCAQIFDPRGRPPRLHDLRHSFAVEALRRGYRAGRDAQATLPRLARYLGHASPLFTHYYLKFTEPVRHAAADRFRQHLAASLFPARRAGSHQGGRS